MLSSCTNSQQTPEPTPVHVNVRATMGALLVPVRYRVTGVVGKLSGSYTGADGSKIPIDSKTARTAWETTVQMSVDSMRKNSMTLTAETDSGANITLEIYADGQLRGTQTGIEPTITVIKH